MGVSSATLQLLVEMKDEASAGLGNVTSALGTLGTAGLAVAAAGVAALSVAVVKGVGDAQEARKLYASTEQTIKTMGNAAGRSADQVVDLASSLSDAAGKSLFGDDQIQASENLLLTFGNIKGETFDLATALTTDLAQALGGAPADQAMMLGKALNDPIKGMSALGKAGLTFSADQKAAITAMQESGDMAGAQAIIIAELNKQVGGQAQAAAAAAGGWTQFQAQMGEVAETVGAALLPLLDQLGAFLVTTVAPAITTVAAAMAAWLADPAVQAGIQQLADAISTGLAVAFDFLANTAIPALVGAWGLIQPAIAAILPLFTGDMPSALDTTGTTFTMLQDTITKVMDAIMLVVGAVLPQIAAFWEQNGASIMAFVQSTWDSIQSIIQLALQLIQAIIVPILAAIAGFIEAHGADIQAILKATWDYISGVITVALHLIQGLLKTVLLAINGDWTGAWEMLKQTSAEFVQGIIDVVTTTLGDLQGVFDRAIEGIQGAWAGLVDGASDIGGNIISGIISGIENGVGALVSAVENAASDALEAAKSLLDMGSPSRVFAEQVGQPIMSGIAAGIEAGQAGMLSSLNSALSTASAVTVPPLSSSGAARAAGPADSQGGQTITIVIDDKNSDWLKKLIDVQIDSRFARTGTQALARARTGG